MSACASVLMRLAPALAILLLLAPLHGAQGQAIQKDEHGTLKGRLHSMDDISGTQEPAAPLYYLHENGNGTIYRVIFCADASMADVPALGELVTLEYDKIVDGVVRSCSKPVLFTESTESEAELPNRRALLGESITTPRSARILIYLVTLCGSSQPLAMNPQELTDTLLKGSGAHLGRSLPGYYQTCSNGQVTLDANNVKVLGPVQIPCTGTSPFPFGSSSTFNNADGCTNDNMLKWHFWLADWASKRGVNPADYHHRVMMLPRSFSSTAKGCPGWAGAATNGRVSFEKTAVNDWGSGLVWMSGEHATNLEMTMHEIGHNYGMAHANVPGNCDWWDQCDNTCTLGARGGQGIRCLNAPHNWQVGWGRPMQQLDDNSLQVGASRTLRIPNQLSSSSSFVMVTGSGLPSGQRLFVSSRPNAYPYDLPWQSWEDNKGYLVFHTYDGTDSSPYRVTVNVGNVLPGSIWRVPNTNLVVKYDSWSTTTGATVRLCRRQGGNERTCGDNLDDDCDFLTDAEDPDCAAGRAAPRSPSPPSPPPPRSPPVPRPPPPRTTG